MGGKWDLNGTYYGLTWDLPRTNLFRTQRHKDAEIIKTLRPRGLAFKTIQTRVKVWGCVDVLRFFYVFFG